MENNTGIDGSKQTDQKEDGSLWELVKFAFLALIIVLPIRMFIAQPFIVSGSSMSPTFENGEYLVIDQISYRFQEPKRGDIIIFRYPKDTTKFFIKRVIGLPNEIVDIKGNTITIINKEYPEGLVLTEPYVKNKSEDSLRRTLASDEYFVLGDNRSGSSDSRSWGMLSRKLIIGRPFIRVLPLSETSLFPGEYTK